MFQKVHYTRTAVRNTGAGAPSPRSTCDLSTGQLLSMFPDTGTDSFFPSIGYLGGVAMWSNMTDDGFADFQRFRQDYAEMCIGGYNPCGLRLRNTSHRLKTVSMAERVSERSCRLLRHCLTTSSDHVINTDDGGEAKDTDQRFPQQACRLPRSKNKAAIPTTYDLVVTSRNRSRYHRLHDKMNRIMMGLALLQGYHRPISPNSAGHRLPTTPRLEGLSCDVDREPCRADTTSQ